MQNLPDKLYSVDSVVQLEQIAINQFGIPAFDLMKRAGEAVFNVIQSRYPQAKKILVICGAGNNAGDGYVVATLARRVGLEVGVISLTDPASLKNEAQLAFQDWLAVADSIDSIDSVDQYSKNDDLSLIENADLIIDAILGTGLTREVSAQWSKWIDTVNQSLKPVISIDVPSGLYADTGVIATTAIKAEITVCFIGLKQGLFTGQGKDVCGEIIFNDLALPENLFTQVQVDALLIKGVDYTLLPKRKASSHKGCFGQVLIVGGNKGMPGAVILAARAALRTGAGLVTIITIPQHIEAVSAAVPEAMIKTCDEHSVEDLFSESFISDITHVAIGMGLGQDAWSLKLLQQCVKLDKPMLIDADALNLLANHYLIISSAVVITPHPGEASRLLAKTQIQGSQGVQHNRFCAIKELYELFKESESCSVILKGSGTLLFNGHTIKVCNLGSAAMAAPGMGDVLSGIVIGLMAQNIKLTSACELAVCLHAAAADLVTQDKTRGLLASDVIDKLPLVLQ